MDNTQVMSKVLEVGIDSVTYVPSNATRADDEPQQVPKAFIKFIEYKNGQRYFVEHARIFLTNGKMILASVKNYDEKKVYYQDVFTRDAKALPIRKVSAIEFSDDQKVNFTDKINLHDGNYLAGKIIEITENKVFFENINKRNRKQNIEINLVRSIEFKNGFEQTFTSTQPNE